jgi:CheY-like chemotaxis protein
LSHLRSTSLRAPRSVLVVEDAPDVRELFAEVLQDAGYRVECAESVQEALRVLRTGAGVDVIVADYNLGDGTGAELIHQACNEGHLDLTATATLICTAYRYVELPPHVGMLRKPVDATQLLLVVARALGGENVANPA